MRKFTFCALFIFSAMLSVAHAVIYYSINGQDFAFYVINTETNTVKLVANPESSVGYRGDVVIPETFTESGTLYTVKEIGDEAFLDAIYLNSISLPSTIECIGSKAFYNCSSLCRMFMWLDDITPFINAVINGSDAFEFQNNYATLYYPKKYATIWFEHLDMTDSFKGGSFVIDEGEVSLTLNSTPNMVDFCWFMVNGVDEYHLTIYEDGVLYEEYSISNGIIIKLSAAKYAPAATLETSSTDEMLIISLGPLSSGSEYSYNITGQDISGNTIYDASGEFYIDDEGVLNQDVIYSGLNRVVGSKVGNAQKVLRDGQIYIISSDKTYSAKGEEIK